MLISPTLLPKLLFQCDSEDEDEEEQARFSVHFGVQIGQSFVLSMDFSLNFDGYGTIVIKQYPCGEEPASYNFPKLYRHKTVASAL